MRPYVRLRTSGMSLVITLETTPALQAVTPAPACAHTLLTRPRPAAGVGFIPVTGGGPHDFARGRTTVTFPQVAFVLALAQGSVRLIEVSADVEPTEVALPDMPQDAASAAGRSSIADRAPVRRERPRCAADPRRRRTTGLDLPIGQFVPAARSHR